MNYKLTFRKRVIITTLVSLLIWSQLAWDFFHNGVPVHYIMRNKDLPGMSNWWGGLVIPLITWALLYLIQKRIERGIEANADIDFSNWFYRFSGALVFGLFISLLFTFGSEITGYLMIGAILLSFVIPLYPAEYLLGFILGMTYTFGAILPLIVGAILCVIFWISYKIIRRGILQFIYKIGKRD